MNKPVLSVLFLLSGAVLFPVALGGNLVVNGDFEAAARGKEISFWTMPHPAPQLTASRVRAGGNHCARITARRPLANPGAIFAQVNQVGAKKGHWYRVSFRARCKGLASIANQIYVCLTHVGPWKVAWGDHVELTEDWEDYAYTWQASRDIPKGASRLQFNFVDGAGSVWLDDVSVQEVPAPVAEVAPRFTVPEGVNLLKNAGFEYGTHGWLVGSDRDIDVEWQLDKEYHVQGRQSLRGGQGPTGAPCHE